MTYHTPAAFAGRYHAIGIQDPLLGISTTVDVQRYISGWKPENQAEFYRLLSVLAARMKLKSPAAVRALSQPFFITGHPDRINPGEEWYDASLSRAYAGRASPDEISDAIRLAVFCGLNTQNKVTISAEAYGRKWFGLDCNAFVGNWLGISPSSAIFAYAHGYGTSEKLSGASPDVYATRKRLPVAPLTDPALIGCGSIVCTFGEKDTRGLRWRHIALVERIEPVQGDSYLLWLAEWGQGGDIEKHRTSPAKGKPVTITLGRHCADLPGKDVLAFDSTDPQGKPAKRIFFDHHSMDDLPHRGWHVGGMYGV
jgi:hypothetical protein